LKKPKRRFLKTERFSVLRKTKKNIFRTNRPSAYKTKSLFSIVFCLVKAKTDFNKTGSVLNQLFKTFFKNKKIGKTQTVVLG